MNTDPIDNPGIDPTGGPDLPIPSTQEQIPAPRSRNKPKITEAMKEVPTRKGSRVVLIEFGEVEIIGVTKKRDEGDNEGNHKKIIRFRDASGKEHELKSWAFRKAAITIVETPPELPPPVAENNIPVVPPQPSPPASQPQGKKTPSTMEKINKFFDDLL